MDLRIDMQSLRLSLMVGAVAGLILGMLASQPLEASPPGAEAVATPSCARLCESVTWVRAPVRYRGSATRGL